MEEAFKDQLPQLIGDRLQENAVGIADDLPVALPVEDEAVLAFEDAIVNRGGAIRGRRAIADDGEALLDVDDGMEQVGPDEEGGTRSVGVFDDRLADEPAAIEFRQGRSFCSIDGLAAEDMQGAMQIPGHRMAAGGDLDEAVGQLGSAAGSEDLLEARGAAQPQQTSALAHKRRQGFPLLPGQPGGARQHQQAMAARLRRQVGGPHGGIK